MRGGDDAGRHVRQGLRRGLRILADVARAVARDVAERSAESAQASPTRVKRDLAHGHLRVAEQCLGLFDAAREQVTMRRKAEGFLELASEVRGGDVADLGQALYGPFLVGSGVHAVFRTEQAAQKVGVLVVGRCVHWR